MSDKDFADKKEAQKEEQSEEEFAFEYCDADPAVYICQSDVQCD